MTKNDGKWMVNNLAEQKDFINALTSGLLNEYVSLGQALSNYGN